MTPGRHRDPEPDPAWFRFVQRHPETGFVIMFGTALIAMWVYTYKAFRDAGWVGLVLILPLSLEATALCWVILKFARLMSRR